MTTIATKVTSRTATDGSPYWESTVTVPGAKPTKLVKKSDGCTHYTTKSAATQAAKKFAASVGMDWESECATSCTTTKAAAKKSSTKKKTSKSKKTAAKRSTTSRTTTKSKRKSR